MDLSKNVTDWDEEEVKVAIGAFVNHHNSYNYGHAVCKFKRIEISEWFSKIYESSDASLMNRFANHVLLIWLKLKLVRNEGGVYVAMVGSVVDDEYWVICGERVDRLALLTVLKRHINNKDFSFEHFKVERANSFEGALRIAGFSIDDVNSTIPSAVDNRRARRTVASVVEANERRRNRDVE
jgi:hypothetical protein